MRNVHDKKFSQVASCDPTLVLTNLAVIWHFLRTTLASIPTSLFSTLCDLFIVENAIIGRFEASLFVLKRAVASEVKNLAHREEMLRIIFRRGTAFYNALMPGGLVTAETF